MAATTLSAILERFETIVQAPPLNLTLSVQPFGDKTEPNSVVETLVRIVSEGLAGARSESNYAEARMDRICVYLYRSLDFDGYAAQRAINDLCDDVVRALIADGPDHGYDITEEKASRKITQPKDTDLIRAEMKVVADYDWNEA